MIKVVVTTDLATVNAELKKQGKLEKTQAQFDAEKKQAEDFKLKSSKGFAGIHLGYLGRVNDMFLLGGLVEGNWVFGQDMKAEGEAVETTLKNIAARFNANLFLRAMFNLTERFMVGADLGVAFQEIRSQQALMAAAPTSTETDKKSSWYWAPAARLVFGFAITDHILATAHVGGAFGVKQDFDTFNSKAPFGVKAKCSNWHGGVGISYAFGG